MNSRLVLVAVLSYAGGAGAWLCYRASAGLWGSGNSQADGAAGVSLETSVSGPGQGRVPGTLVLPNIKSGGPLGLAGLSGRPTMDDLFIATGIDRPLRIAFFLQTATSDELSELIRRGKKEWTYDNSLTDQIWLRWVEIDRAAAFKADSSGAAVWWAWAKLDPAGALAEASASGGSRAIEEVIRSIGQGDQDAAIRLLSTYPAADTPLVWDGILSGISKSDRGAAVALALEKNLKLDEYVGDWVEREPEAALTWARGLGDPVQRRRVMDLAVQGLITADPRAALAELERLPAGRSRTERTAEAIAALSRTDPAGARSAAEALPNPADRQRALFDLTETLAARNPAAALDILKGLSWVTETQGWIYESGSHRSSGGVSRGPDHQSIRQLMQTAPEATANLLVTLPPERHAPLEQAVRQWTASQPEAASRWVAAMPVGPTKDTAIMGLTQWLTEESPEPDYDAALAWGAAASTEELRFNTMQNTLSVWRNQDWKAARAAVDRLPLTPEQREQMLQNFGNAPQNP